MQWEKLFGAENQPDYEDMERFIGGKGQKLWSELFQYMEKSYKAKPKMTYSVCSGKPGWNVKFQKSGQAFGTLYPEKNAFSVFIVIAYKLEKEMKAIKPKLSDEMRERYNNADDFMKNGRWMMFQVKTKSDLEDYKLLISAKMQPKE